MSEPAVSAVLGAWLALRRLDRGRVAHADGLLLDEGRRLPGYLAAPLTPARAARPGVGARGPHPGCT